MTTIINTPPTNNVAAEEGSAGWIVATIILLAAIIIGGYFWMNYNSAKTPADSGQNGATNINVTLPAPAATNSSNSSN